MSTGGELSQYPILFGTVVACTAFAWFMMICLPRWEYTYKLMQGNIMLVPHLALYTYVVLPQVPQQFAQLLATASAETGISALMGLGSPAMAGLHLLTFNLFVGKWVWQQRRVDDLNDLFCSLILTAIMLNGPLGLAIYLLITEGRALSRRHFSGHGHRHRPHRH